MDDIQKFIDRLCNPHEDQNVWDDSTEELVRRGKKSLVPLFCVFLENCSQPRSHERTACERRLGDALEKIVQTDKRFFRETYLEPLQNLLVIRLLRKSNRRHQT